MLLMGKSTISMAIFHCYVSSPEGSLAHRNNGLPGNTMVYLLKMVIFYSYVNVYQAGYIEKTTQLHQPLTFRLEVNSLNREKEALEQSVAQVASRRSAVSMLGSRKINQPGCRFGEFTRPGERLQKAMENGPVEIVNFPSYIAWWIFAWQNVSSPEGKGIFPWFPKLHPTLSSEILVN